MLSVLKFRKEIFLWKNEDRKDRNISWIMKWQGGEGGISSRWFSRDGSKRALPWSCNTRSRTEIISACERWGEGERRSSGTSQEFLHYAPRWFNLTATNRTLSLFLRSRAEYLLLSAEFHRLKERLFALNTFDKCFKFYSSFRQILMGWQTRRSFTTISVIF